MSYFDKVWCFLLKSKPPLLISRSSLASLLLWNLGKEEKDRQIKDFMSLWCPLNQITTMDWWFQSFGFFFFFCENGISK